MTQIGSLAVDLTAKIAGFEANMNKANAKMQASQTRMNRSLSKIEQGFDKVGKRVAAFAGAAGAAIAIRAFENLSKNAITFGDNLAKQADRIGFGVEALQELRFAGERAGIGLANTDAGLIRFSKTVGEARAQTGSLYTLLKKLDPTLLSKLINADSVEGALKVMLDRLEQTENAMDRNALASAAFGRQSGSAFGAAAGTIDDLRKRLHAMGGVLQEGLARKAEAAADTLTNLETTLRVKLNTAVLENIDGFISFKTLLNDLAIIAVRFTSKIGKAADGLERFFDRLPGASIRDGSAVDDLLVRRTRLIGDLDRAMKLAQSNGVRNNAFLEPGVRQQPQKSKQEYEAEAKRIARELLAVDLAIASEREKKLATKLPAAASPGGGAPAAFSFSGKTPGVPSLKSDALARDAEKMQDKIAGIVERMRTPLQNVKLELAEIKALQPFANSPEQAEALAARASELQKEMKALTAATKDWHISGVEAGRGIADAFASAAIYGDNLLKSLVSLAKQLAFKGLSNLIFSGLSGGSGGGLFGGFRAAGGPVMAGRSYVVGERGPELFSPGVSGGITPNGGGSGGSVFNITNNISFDATVESMENVVRAAAPSIAAATIQAFDKIRTRSPYA